jgi:epoxyqueuosine reductase QueG
MLNKPTEIISCRLDPKWNWKKLKKHDSKVMRHKLKKSSKLNDMNDNEFIKKLSSFRISFIMKLKHSKNILIY